MKGSREKPRAYNCSGYSRRYGGIIYCDSHRRERKLGYKGRLSRYEPRRMEGGELVEGDYRDKYISARAWNANVNEGDNFSFISTVPQLVNEYLEKSGADMALCTGDLGIFYRRENFDFLPKYFQENNFCDYLCL